MALASTPYSSRISEVKGLQEKLDKAYEYDFGRPKNEITVKQWEKLLNPDGDLLGGFLREWKDDGKLLPGYIRSKQTQIERGFDTIIGLESGKIKPSAVQ